MSQNKTPEVFQKGWKPPQEQQERVAGRQKILNPKPIDDITADGHPYKSANKLEGRAALITGADSGIGRSVAILFALEGADLTISYRRDDEEDAREVEKYIKSKTKTKVLLVPADLRDETKCKELIDSHIHEYGRLDNLVLNHGKQVVNENITSLPTDQWHDVFQTNVHSFFYLSRFALPHMKSGATIVFNASIAPSIGHPLLVDYTAAEGAIVGFARALSNQIVGEKGIRVNVVAPGVVWTPLIASSMRLGSLGENTPLQRAAQPVEIAASFVFLSSADSSYISGQVVHVNGGVVIA